MPPKKLYRWIDDPLVVVRKNDDPSDNTIANLEIVPLSQAVAKRPRGHPRTLDAAERTNLVIPRALNDRLDAEVKRRGVSRSQLVRDAIEKELGE